MYNVKILKSLCYVEKQMRDYLKFIFILLFTIYKFDSIFDYLTMLFMHYWSFFQLGIITDYLTGFYFFQPQMIRKAGFRAETHIVQTEDGYLLSLYRIPGKNDSSPVLLQHGLLTSSVDWIIPGSDKGLGTILINP